MTLGRDSARAVFVSEAYVTGPTTAASPKRSFVRIAGQFHMRGQQDVSSIPCKVPDEFVEAGQPLGFSTQAPAIQRACIVRWVVTRRLSA